MGDAKFNPAAEPTAIVPRLPLMQRLQYSFIIHSLQMNQALYCFFRRLGEVFLKPAIRPDIEKTYPVRRNLPIRIFFPPSIDRRSSSTSPLPTLFTIHGGGFALGRPWDTDAWNAAFAARHGTLVIALNYDKAPRARFPQPILDAEALLLACLDDASLPIDRSRVAVAGWSAGGTLALALAQQPGVRALQPPLRAVIPMYPAADLTMPPGPKATRGGGRRFKPALGGFRGPELDMLEGMSPALNWAYLPPGTDTTDPVVSAVFAAREALPRHVFVVGCELDMLANEAWRLAWRLAGKKGAGPRATDVVGRAEVGKVGELVLQGDERFAWEERGEESGSVRWLLVPDAIHGYDQESVLVLTGDREMVKDALMKREKVIDEIGQWLFKGPFQGK